MQLRLVLTFLSLISPGPREDTDFRKNFRKEVSLNRVQPEQVETLGKSLRCCPLLEMVWFLRQEKKQVGAVETTNYSEILADI